MRGPQSLRQCRVEGLAAGEVPVVDAAVRNAQGGGTLEHAGGGHVRDHEHHVAGYGTAPAGLGNGLHVGAIAGGQDGQAAPTHPAYVTEGWPSTIPPMRQA